MATALTNLSDHWAAIKMISFSSPGMQSPETEKTRRVDGSIFKRLRSETRTEHERLEADLNLIRDDLSRLQYRRLLARFYGFFQPWESKIAGQIERGLPEFGAVRLKTPLLEADLRFLDVETQRVELCTDLPSCRALPELLGSLYVTEGSTLGGQLIARHVEKQLGFSDGQGYAFFGSYKSDVGRMWQAFQGILIAHLPEATEDAAVASARATFRLMHAWLCSR